MQEALVHMARAVGFGLQVISSSPLLKFLLLAHILVGLFLAIIWIRLHPQAYFLHLIVFNSLLLFYTFISFLPAQLVLPYLAYLRFARYTQIAFHIVGLLWLGLAPSGYGFRLLTDKEKKRLYGRTGLLLVSATLLATAMLLDIQGLWFPIPGFDKMLWLVPTAIVALLSLYFSSRNLIRSISEYFVFIGTLACFALASYTHIFVDMTLSLIPAFIGGLFIIALILLYHRHFFQTEAELRNGLLQESQQLREENRIQNKVLDTTSLGFAYLDPDEKLVYANPAFHQWCHPSSNADSGSPLKKQLGKDNYQALTPALQEARLGQTGRITCSWQTNSVRRQVRVEIVPLLNARKKIEHFLLMLQDITEDDRDADRARDLLEQQEQQVWLYRSALESAPDGVCLCEPNGNIHFANPAFSRLTGHSVSDLRKHGLPVLRRADSAPAALLQSLQTARAWHGHIEAVRRDGSRYRAEITLLPLPQRESQPPLLLWIERDAAAWQQQEARLREAQEQARRQREELRVAEQFYRSLLGSLDVGLILVRPDGACRALNAQVESLLGIRGDEIALKNLPPFIRDLLRFEANYSDRLQSQIAEFTDAYRQPGGRMLHLRWRVIPIPGQNGPSHILLQIEDASQQRQNEQRLAELQEQLQQARLQDAHALEREWQTWQALFDLAELVQTARDEAALARRFLQALRDMGWQRFALYLRDTGERYALAAGPGRRKTDRTLPEQITVGQVLPMLRPAFARGSAFVIPPEALQEWPKPGLQKWLQKNAGPALVSPIGAMDAPLALLLVSLAEPPDESVLQWLQRWTMLLESGLSRLREARLRQRQAEYERLLLDLETIVQSETGLESQLARVAERLLKTLPAGLLLAVDEHRTLAFWTNPGRQSARGKFLSAATAKSLLRCLRPHLSGKSAVLLPMAEVASELERWLPSKAVGSYSALLAADLRKKQKRFGVIGLLLPEARPDAAMREFFDRFSERMAGWLESQLLFEAFEQKARELERANLLISEFLANVSHELRTPLNSILSYVEVMRRKKPLSDRDKQHYLDIISNSGDHLLALINDLLDLSKIEAGRMAPNLAPCSPAQVLDEVVNKIRPLCDQKGLQLHTHIGKTVPEAVVSDPELFQRVLLNLARNAQKFTDKGQVSLSLGWEKASSSLVFRIKDTGIGIPKSKQKAIFEPFYQVERSASRRYEGTGLGLAITQKIVHLLNGSIEVQSEPGRGTQFIVKIPVQTASKAAPAPTAARPTRRRRRLLSRKPRILLVDDDLSTREAMQFLLEEAGYQVEFADDGPAAISAAQRLHPDLILLDIMMPGMDGYQVARTLKSQKHLRDIPIIALSARAMVEDQQKAHEAGCEDFLTKPFAMNDFYRILEKYLNHHG
ncbi:MAG: response regulator [candidate division KSB1 bacterium]|nr:response regulator [candidate division KSB1 bacterium]